MWRPLALVLLLPWAPAVPAPEEAPDLRKAVSRGVAFLVGTQNPDGSWGSPLGGHPDDVWSNAETNRAWRVATTGLCCQALMEHAEQPGAGKALEAGMDALLANAALKRPSDWDVDHVWGWIFALETLAKAERHAPLASRRDRIRPSVDALLGSLAGVQSPSGGWAYYDFGIPTHAPSWTTSFTTSSAILAMHEARLSGHALPPAMLREAVKAVRRCRLPDGAYTYQVQAVPAPYPASENIRNVKGSLSRIQVANLALFLEEGGVGREDLERGLDLFFEHHRFLDVACGRPIPHEAYSRNAGYFYLYGHAYAGRVLRQLPAEAQGRYRPRLEHEVLKLQGPDGSWWDFPIQGYFKPYGTAFALLALGPG